MHFWSIYSNSTTKGNITYWEFLITKKAINPTDRNGYNCNGVYFFLMLHLQATK